MRDDGSGTGGAGAARTGLATVHHLGYVVADLAAAAQSWNDIAGIGPFVALAHLRYDEITVDGGPVSFDHTAAFAAYGTMFVELQLIHGAEPPSVREHFEVAGPVGLSHVSYVVADAQAESARLAGLGLPPRLRARSGDLNVVLHDAPGLGFAVEIHQDSDFLTGFFEQVRQAAGQWDGQELIQFLPG
jgi:methylmalonyl-CoA/ethylmalonyl-CoA epimerase